MSRLAIAAEKQPLISTCLKNMEVIININPFIKIKNIPKVIIVIGRLIKTNIGFRMVFTIPSTIEKNIAVTKSFT